MGPYAACFSHPAVTAPAACAERLAAALQIKCLTGLADAKVKNTTAQGRPANFDEWIMRVMGGGIADLFMRPYNFKVGAQPWTVSVCLPYAALAAFAVPVELSAAAIPSQLLLARFFLLLACSVWGTVQQLTTAAASSLGGPACSARAGRSTKQAFQLCPLLLMLVVTLLQVWAVPPKDMQCEWLGERVATVDIDRAITNVINNKEDAG